MITCFMSIYNYCAFGKFRCFALLPSLSIPNGFIASLFNEAMYPYTIGVPSNPPHSNGFVPPQYPIIPTIVYRTYFSEYSLTVTFRTVQANEVLHPLGPSVQVFESIIRSGVSGADTLVKAYLLRLAQAHITFLLRQRTVV